jgi:putative restriction endonuclease
VVAGFGTFVYHSVVPLHLAWDAFGEVNGCGTMTELIELIGQYRHAAPQPEAAMTWQIGCTMLSNVRFYPESEWLPLSFPPGLMTGKSLDVQSEGGQLIWGHMQRYAQKREAGPSAKSSYSLVAEERALYETVKIKQRIGQGAFRVMVLDAYNRRCCMTGERTLPVVDAAHIQKHVSIESNDVRNGLALRKDIHSLFDSGFIAVNQDYKVLVSNKIQKYYENGREYRQLEGREIVLPGQRNNLPSKEAIQWHLDTVFLG